jgi:hypothetical protein
LGAEVRIFRVGSTFAVLTKMSTAGLIVMVTISLTACNVTAVAAVPATQRAQKSRPQMRPAL